MKQLIEYVKFAYGMGSPHCDRYVIDLCAWAESVVTKVEKLQAENAQLRKERDAAVADLKRETAKQCSLCRFASKTGWGEIDCCCLAAYKDGEHWEWRGVQEA